MIAVLVLTPRQCSLTRIGEGGKWVSPLSRFLLGHNLGRSRLHLRVSAEPFPAPFPVESPHAQAVDQPELDLVAGHRFGRGDDFWTVWDIEAPDIRVGPGPDPTRVGTTWWVQREISHRLPNGGSANQACSNGR